MIRRNNPESYTKRLASARARAVDHCVAFFHKSGVTYTCLAVAVRTVRPELTRIAALDEYAPYNIDTRSTLNKITARIHADWKAADRELTR